MLFWCNSCGMKFIEDNFYWCDIVNCVHCNSEDTEKAE